MDTGPDVNGAKCSTEPTENDWERLKPIIQELYQNNKLEDVMKIMKQDYRFRARY